MGAEKQQTATRSSRLADRQVAVLVGDEPAVVDAACQDLVQLVGLADHRGTVQIGMQPVQRAANITAGTGQAE